MTKIAVYGWTESKTPPFLKFSPINGLFPSISISIERLPQLKVFLHQRLSSIKRHLLSEVVFYWRFSSSKGFLLSKDDFHQRWFTSFLEMLSSSKVVFPHRLSSIEDLFLLEVVYHWNTPSNGGLPPLKVVFQFQCMLSSIRGCLPLEIVFHQSLSFSKGHINRIEVWLTGTELCNKI